MTRELKKLFHPAPRGDPESVTHIMACQARIEDLHRQWRRRLELQEREMAWNVTDAAVSVALLSQVAASSRPLPIAVASSRPLLVAPARTTDALGSHEVMIQTGQARREMIQTASWLERANTLLESKKTEGEGSQNIKDEMKEISLLLAESPEIFKNVDRISKHT